MVICIFQCKLKDFRRLTILCFSFLHQFRKLFNTCLWVCFVLWVHKWHQYKILFEKFVAIIHIRRIKDVLRYTQCNIIKAKCFSTATIAIPAELIAQYNNCESALSIIFPVLKFFVTDSLDYFFKFELNKLVSLFSAWKPFFGPLFCLWMSIPSWLLFSSVPEVSNSVNK